MATGMPIPNQIIIHCKKHTSIATLNRYYRNVQLVVAIGTHKGNHLLHHSINTNLLQRLFQQTQTTFSVAIGSKYRNPLIRWLL
jgi:hypothetical protein